MVLSRFPTLRLMRAAFGLFLVAAPAGVVQAQVTPVDPNSVFEVPLTPQQAAHQQEPTTPQQAETQASPPASPSVAASASVQSSAAGQGPLDVPASAPATAPTPTPAQTSAQTSAPTTVAPSDAAPAPQDAATPTTSVFETTAAPANTHKKDDLIGAAEGVFGKGAKGLAEILEKILADQGEPNAYIAGREASGAFLVGLRYGSGTMVHTVEGQRPVYWTGPSFGIDVGGDATKTFVLIYNLYDSQDLYRRYAQVEGRAYFVGGLSATYLRRGDVAIIPIRMGVGMRLGANVGYMKFTEKSRWLPF